MKTLKTAIALSLILLIYSCKKNQLGGKAEVSGVVKHHEKIIGNSRVFVKFNATEFPGNDTTKYDTRIVTDAEGNFSMKFYKGNYYFYSLGYDAGVPGVVSGGTPLKLRNKEKVDLIVPVTEH